MPGFSMKLKGEGTDPKYCCSSCALLLNEPRQTSCGHRYCKSCLEDLNRAGAGMCTCKAAVCGEQIKIKEVFPDKAIEREMKSIPVVCINDNDGCEWEGLLKDVKDHRNECEYEMIACVHKGCKEKIRRMNLAEHLSGTCIFRSETCPWCLGTYPMKDRVVHQGSCGFAPVRCDWCGKKGLTRAQLPEHQREDTGDCPNVKIPCTFAPVGCMEMIQRRHLEDHQQQCFVAHQRMLLTKVLLVISTLEERQRQEQEPTLERRIQDIEAKVSRLIRTGSAVDCQQNTTGLPPDVAGQLQASRIPNVVGAHPNEGHQQESGFPVADANDNVMQRPEQQMDIAPPNAPHANNGAPPEQETTDPEMQRRRIIELEKKVAMLESLMCVLLKDRDMLSQA